MLRAERLGASAKLFSAAPEQLDARDLYTFDVCVAATPGARARALAIFRPELEASEWDGGEASDELAHYRQRVCCLADFLGYARAEQLAHTGATSLLPRRFASLIEGRGGAAGIQAAGGVSSAGLDDVDAWNAMICAIVVAAAGCVQYLMDTYPPELRQAWLE